MNEKDFLDIIDSRIRKIITEEKMVYRYVGVVTSIKTDNQYGVKLMGYTNSSDQEFTFYNRSSVPSIEVGTKVHIETIGKDLNTGMITQVFDEAPPYIVESGSNALGKYIKFSDGTAIAWQSFTRHFTSFVTWGSLYTTDVVDAPNFPITFVEPPNCQVTLGAGANGGFIGCRSTGSGITTTKNDTIAIFRGTSTTNATYTFNQVAIGKWK